MKPKTRQKWANIMSTPYGLFAIFLSLIAPFWALVVACAGLYVKPTRSSLPETLNLVAVCMALLMLMVVAVGADSHPIYSPEGYVPVEYWGTSSALYGEVDECGDVVHTPEALSSLVTLGAEDEVIVLDNSDKDITIFLT